MKFTYDNIDFNITNIEIEEKNFSNFSFPYKYQIPKKDIKITATTNINNYNLIQNIFLKTLNGSVKTYKKDLNLKLLKIYSMFPIEIKYNNFNIEVIFTADWFEGEYNIISYKQIIRKQKLKILNKICQNEPPMII